jgi:hypothetical protein
VLPRQVAVAQALDLVLGKTRRVKNGSLASGKKPFDHGGASLGKR